MIWNSSLNKARMINQDAGIYGTFAEIGAGQEVARFFFLAGQASQTIAKTMSAYDMVFSDEIYGKEKSGRYVCQNRVEKMLDKEYQLILRRLEKTRGAQSRFFAFADTVATSRNKQRPSHGWLGIRFQHQNNAIASQVTLHVELLDHLRLQQQETLGILGVDLIHAAYFKTQNEEDFLRSLTENIKAGQVRIDMIQVSGPAFEYFNNSLLNYLLVQNHWSEAIYFNSQGQAMNPSDAFFNQPILLQRGHFYPVTTTHIDIMQKADTFFSSEFNHTQKPNWLFELTIPLLQDYHPEFKQQQQSFLARLNMLTQLGYPVLLTQFVEFYRLKEFLRRFTKEPLSIVIPASHLPKLFSSSHYQELGGGLLEGLGKLLDPQTHFYVYPHKTKNLCETASSFKPAGEDALIYQYFQQKKWIRDLAGCDEIQHYIRSEEARAQITKLQPGWEQLVPVPVAHYINKHKNLFIESN